jgi:lysylphosphatidylglycerol synthetase-like protein (DUF2156 family)
MTRQLARHRKLAWSVTTVALTVSLLLHITRALDLHHSLVAGLLLLYLISFRHRFTASSDPAGLRLGIVSAILLAGLIFLYGYVGLRHMAAEFSWDPGNTPAQEAFRSALLIIDPHLDPNTAHAARFLGSVQIAGWLARIYVLFLLLRPVILRDRMRVATGVIQQLFQQHSRFSLSAFALQPDKHHRVLSEGRSLVAYTVRSDVALCCGDPLAAEAELESAARDFADFCQRNGWTPCFYEAAELRLPVYHRLGFRSLKMAEEAIVELEAFTLSGSPRAKLRAMVNKGVREGLRVEPYTRAMNPDFELDEQLTEISAEWLSEKKMGEMGFTLGHFSLEALNACRVFLCHSETRVEAFCTWLPYRQGTAVVLDLMRKRGGAPPGTMDILLAKSLAALQQEGLREASLANAPLANVEGPRNNLERGVNLLFENLNAFYGYKNLFQFKKKFAPRWEGRYLVYPGNADLPRVAYALTSVHRPGGWLDLLRRK